MSPIDQAAPARLTAQAEAWREPLVEFARRLVRLPSPSGEEGAVAEALLDQMRALGFDEAFTDPLGNVVGRIRGNGTGPSTLFVAHMDHAPAGDRSQWAHDPFGGELQGGFLYGRGASDAKGALAAMVYAGAMLKALGFQPGGDFLFAATVQELQMASIGMRYLLDKTLPERGWHADLVVLGNPTGLNLNLSHRGRLELEVLTIGRTCHSGAPWLGSNAVYKMMPVLTGVQDLATKLPSHPFLEKSTLALTAIRSAPEGATTVPDVCAITLDRRFLPSESVDDVVWQVQSIVNRLASEDPEFKAEVRVGRIESASYTGERQSAGKLMHPLINETHHALIKGVVSALEGLGQHPAFGRWTFTTDGGYPSTVKNLTTLGYAPGEETFSQTPFDRVAIDQLVQAAAGYAAICLTIGG